MSGERVELRKRAKAVGLCGDCAFPHGPCCCGFDLPHYKTTKSMRERIETYEAIRGSHERKKSTR